MKNKHILLTSVLLLFCSLRVTAQDVTCIWVEGDVWYQSPGKNMVKLKKDDDLNYQGNIHLRNKNAFIILGIGEKEVRGKGNEVSNPVVSIKAFEAETQRMVEEAEASKSIWDNIYELFSITEEENYAPVSAVSRGVDDKLQFYLGSNRVLKGCDATIAWEPTNEDNRQYTIKLSNEGTDEDATPPPLADTIITIPAAILESCSPCELTMAAPSEKYGPQDISAHELSEARKPLYTELLAAIDKNPGFSAYQFALIQLLIAEGYIASAHSYYLEFLDSAPAESQLHKEYSAFLKRYYGR